MSHKSLWNSQASLSRRHLLLLSGAAALGASTASVTGCAVNPVTGRQQFMLMSEEEEISIDKRQSPHQFSSDYGAVQDPELQNYIQDIGRSLARNTQRPQMPYSFRVVNANYVNAYAFPGGSIAATRGILISLDNEAELAGLLGHELGHVNARHTAASMSRGAVLGMALGGIGVMTGQSDGQGGLGEVLQQVGQLGGQVLLASYSRDNERQADALGMEYMVKADYSADGMVGLMDLLRSLHRQSPSALELMFSTHPMSDERFSNALNTANTKYLYAANQAVHRERYMDKTARLRAQAPTIKKLEQAEQFMGQKDFARAQPLLNEAVAKSPNDYAARVLLAKCHLMQRQAVEARPQLEKATSIYPEEAQAHNLLGMTYLVTKQPDRALAQFTTYDRLMPGNPGTTFLQGYSHEMMSEQKQAAEYYHRFLQQVNRGPQAQYAFGRLRQWGYI